MPIANHLHEYSCTGRPERVPDVDRRGLVRALVLIEKAQLRGDRAGQREQDAQIQRHVSSYVDSLKIPRPPCPEGNGLPGESSSTSVPDPQPLSADRARLAVVMKVPSRTRAKLPQMAGRPILSLTLARGAARGLRRRGRRGDAEGQRPVREGRRDRGRQPAADGPARRQRRRHDQRRASAPSRLSAATPAGARAGRPRGRPRPHEEPEARRGRGRVRLQRLLRPASRGLERLQRRSAGAGRAPVRPARRPLRAIRPLLLIDVDGVLSLYGTG